jgi:hypothetical protein
MRTYLGEAINHLIDYILEHESEDFYEQVRDNGITKDNWRDYDHIFVHACLAADISPDDSFFEEPIYEDLRK